MLILILKTHVRFRDIGLQAKIDEESTDYEDILQDVFMDSYNNLTLKTLSALKLALGSGGVVAGNDHNGRGDRGPDYLMLLDDDTYVNIPQ